MKNLNLGFQVNNVRAIENLKLDLKLDYCPEANSDLIRRSIKPIITVTPLIESVDDAVVGFRYNF